MGDCVAPSELEGTCDCLSSSNWTGNCTVLRGPEGGPLTDHTHFSSHSPGEAGWLGTLSLSRGHNLRIMSQTMEVARARANRW